MFPSDLKPGDILFFNTTLDVPSHVAMYTGLIDGKPYITHSVINKTPGLQTTILKRDNEHKRIIVFRANNQELAARAAARLLQWANKYKVPYDNRRKEDMLNISSVLRKAALREQKCEPIDHTLEYLIKEARKKFYERIKFASRRDTCPVKLLEGVQARGFTCAQAIILAYQLEELAPYVKTIAQVQIEMASHATTVEQIKELWISDKHCPKEVLDTYSLLKSYVDYSLALRDKEEFSDFCLRDKRDTPSYPHYHPSLVAWRFDLAPNLDEFIAAFHSVLNLPAKITYTDAMLHLMRTNLDDWSFMGSLDISTLPLTFSEEEKALHRQRTSDLELHIQANREKISRERALTSPGSDQSPRGSFIRTSSEVDLAALETPTSPLLARVFPRLNLS